MVLEKVTPFGPAESTAPCGPAYFLSSSLFRINPTIPTFNPDVFGFGAGTDLSNATEAAPQAGMREDAQTVALHVELPGVVREDIQLENEENTLSIVALRRRAQTLSEQSHPVVYRARVLVPGDVAMDEAQATYANGVLNITIPKRSAGTGAQQRRIPIS